MCVRVDSFAQVMLLDIFNEIKYDRNVYSSRTQTSYKQYKHNDFSILQYLRICKFSIEETKTRIQNYHKLRSDIPEWYANKDPFRPELQTILDLE
ncbi:hypothetical protein P5V15_015077 [Pogonomyrmex californicus]